MLFAHWLYLTAALLKVIYPVKYEENVYLRASLQMEYDRLSAGISMDNSDVHKNFGMKDDLDDLDGLEDDYDEKGL